VVSQLPPASDSAARGSDSPRREEGLGTGRPIPRNYSLYILLCTLYKTYIGEFLLAAS
jgi:hypothetical protein